MLKKKKLLKLANNLLVKLNNKYNYYMIKTMEDTLKELAKKYSNDQDLGRMGRAIMQSNSVNGIFPNDCDLGRELRKNYSI